MENFCSSVIVADAKNFTELCLDWIEIAYKTCIQNAFAQPIPTAVQLWNWMLRIVQSQSKNSQVDVTVTANNTIFLQAPFNLTMLQCQDFLNKIYRGFMSTHEFFEIPKCGSCSDNLTFNGLESNFNEIIVKGFLILFCFVLIAIFVAFKFGSLEIAMKTEVVDEEETEDSKVDSGTTAEVLPEKEKEEFNHNLTERLDATFNDDISESLMDKIFAGEFEESIDYGSLSSSEESLMRLDEQIAKDISKNEINAEALFEKTQTSTPMVFEEKPTVKISPSSSLPIALSKNFIQKNIDNVQMMKKLSEIRISHTPTSSKKSSIPVPVMKFNKENDFGNSSLC